MQGRVAATALLAVLMNACGDDGPSSPSTTPTATTTVPAARSFTIVSGETGEPVAGAELTVGGRTFETGASGEADVGDVRSGTNVGIIAAGFLDRKTVYRAVTETRFALWPATSSDGLTPEITQRLVYTGFGEDAVPGELPMYRVPSDVAVQIFIDPSVPADARVDRVVDDALDAMRVALHDRVDFAVTRTRPARGVVWTVRIDPAAVSSDFIAITRRSFDGNEIVGADLAFRSLPDLVDNGRLLTNLMGTAFGLFDSDNPNDRMFFDWWRRQPNNFSPREGLIMRLMLQRRAGNRWPDNDRSLGTSALHTGSVEFVRSRPF
jgi:hypothetical protein